MEAQVILSFLGAAVLLTIMPGPDNIFVLTESVTKGHKTGIAVSVGLCAGVMVHTIAAATGISIIIQKSALVFSVIKYLGAGYLFFLAYKSYKEKRQIVKFEQVDEVQSGFWKLFRKGLLMNVLNPKVSLFFIALLPQFVRESEVPYVWQMIVLGATFMLQTLVIFSLVAILSGRLSGYLNSPRFWNITHKSKVAVLSVLGLALALSRK
ncbi:LysE family translocator [Plebeiibacterium marinum]|uniref:LysE family translocator n=1 Tax=Plebeiibacterium marinum TaxID=2992111 RepID=A0AAE3MAM0_9BACT|nr:LysE family translocator [Plebeiobacterium marinum]MCW3804378.1 LysE family translocator [Plebeiobacterium marinum]